MLAGVERFAGHLEQRVQGTSLSRCSLAVVTALGTVLLRRFPFKLLLLLLLLQRRMMQARVYTMMQTVMMMMAERVRTSGIGDGASSRRGRAAERRLADGAGRHRRQRHTHQ